MTTPVTAPAHRDAAHSLFSADGVAVDVIRDSPGFVAQRVLAHIVNVACEIAQQRIASPADIDLGAKLGLGYPQGPLAWGDAIGPAPHPDHTAGVAGGLWRSTLSAQRVAVAPRGDSACRCCRRTPDMTAQGE